ncbi:2Fe-2S iron-sulfur cluster protein [Pseudonocardia hierapolitana]|uniref:2Fe-2S iron-sulfur cluster protein n=1 Tax=Pseudonocardia hierapolitana TaxID=1128676 RepID=A0A561SJX4_9PSEU|nr:2Fe-2S iron-sulfur cluster-binding protein [Pseudonocardia hierapolitana]TWF75187.1 2Fe-2S iron-sulfur cluster protein [Pseudonocardia hierapolitana]
MIFGSDHLPLIAAVGAGRTAAARLRRGLCGTCQVGVLQGEVDHLDAALTKAEREAGTVVLTCCSRSRGDRLILDLRPGRAYR